MASTISDLYRSRQGTSLTACAPPEPKCSTCGMLECVCRPRFFAGQVLNADDLNRLDAYIRAKHRLHNRQLHGWGVVNGLEVMCNPCGDGVAVGCGYALSPCGDDIVVCDAVTVDVCDLIKRCKDAERKRVPCDPFQYPQSAACDAAETEWILAIRYSETPTRGVKPLYAPTEVDCGCSCGKAQCTCGGAKAKTSCGCGAKTQAQCTCTTNAKPRGAPVQCEATVVCEGYAFEVYRAPAKTTKPPSSDNQSNAIGADSELIKRYVCCYDDLVTKGPKMPGPFSVPAVVAAPDAWFLWACREQAHLLRHLQGKSGYNCALLAQLAALVIVRPEGAGLPAFIQAVVILFLVLIDALLACLCSALVPPCPMPTDETRVPLASLHVANNPCRVLRVCNWTTERKFATTFPALQYWLSILPYGRALRQLLQTLCCFDVTSIFRNVDVPGTNAQPNAAGPRDAAARAATGGPNAGTGADAFHQQGMVRLNPQLDPATPVHDTTALLVDVLSSGKPLEPEALINTLLAPSVEGDKLAAVESASLPQFLLLNQVAKPMAQAAAGSFAATSLDALVGGLMQAAAGQAPPSRAEAGREAPSEAEAPADADAVATLREEVARLHATIEQHAGEIERLKSGGASARRPRKGNK